MQSLPDLCYPYNLKFGDSSHTCLGTQDILQSQVKCLFKKFVPNAALNVAKSQKVEHPHGCQRVGENHCCCFHLLGVQQASGWSRGMSFFSSLMGHLPVCRVFPLEILVKVRAIHANEKYSP